MEHKPFRTTRHLVNLRQGRNDWYQIRAQAGGPTLVHIYDEIGYFGVTAQDFVNDLGAVQGDIELHLNTPGGEVFDGIAIYNALRPRQPAVVVDSLAASIGSVIAMAAGPGRLEIAKNGTMMIHDGFGMAIGDAADMRAMADLLDKASGNIASIYADRTGLPAAAWRDAMRAETWYVGQEAVDAGLADTVQGAGRVPVAASWDLSVFARGGVLAAWDGDAAMSAAGNASNPAAAYKSICAGRRAGDPSLRKTWALPHHDKPGGPANPDGVSAALGRLDSTQGLLSKAAAEAHLRAHQNSGGGNHAGLEFLDSLLEGAL